MLNNFNNYLSPDEESGKVEKLIADYNGLGEEHYQYHEYVSQIAHLEKIEGNEDGSL